MSRHHRYVVVLMALIALLFSAVTAAAAPILFGTVWIGPSQGGSSVLVQLDPATGGLIQTIGPVGYAVNGLTWDQTTGKLYGGTAIWDPNFNGLIEINRLTGAGTPVGAAKWGGEYAQAAVALASSPAGQLFAWCEDCYVGGDPGYGYWDDLTSIAKSTGIASEVGESGISTGGLGLSFDNFGTLFLMNGGGDYYTVDPDTGESTEAGYLDTQAHHGDFHPLTNLYYGIDSTESGEPYIVVADLSTGEVVDWLPTEPRLHTLTFVDDGTPPIPEPGSLLLLGSGLIGAAGFIRRKLGS